MQGVRKRQGNDDLQTASTKSTKFPESSLDGIVQHHNYAAGPSVEFERIQKIKKHFKDGINAKARMACSGAIVKNLDSYPQLKNELPPGYTYHVCHFQEIPSAFRDHTGFEALIRVQVQTTEQAKEWVKASKKSGVTWRVEKTVPIRGKRVLYKASYRCHHLVHARSLTAHLRSSSKNTGCEAKMCLTLKCQGTNGENSKSQDRHLPDFPFEVRIQNKHNHDLFNAAVLKHRDVGENAIESLTKLLAVGHTATSALRVLKHDLQIQHGEKYHHVSANREICPDINFVKRLCKDTRKTRLSVSRAEDGAQNGPTTTLEALARQVEDYNVKCADVCAKMVTPSTTSGAPLLAICSPLMKRVHKTIKNSGQLCFVDSSGTTDKENCRVFLLLTAHSCAGGLPLGILMTLTSGENQATIIAEGLELLKELVGEDGFARNGPAGPSVFLTDDCAAERGALGRAFPAATLLLCSHHLLRAAWRWLWRKESCVAKGDRNTLFAIVGDMLRGREIADVERLYLQAKSHPLAVRYKNYIQYLERLYSSQRECWALGYRATSHNASKYAEAATRVLKDNILQRTKAFNPSQLFDLLTSRLDAFYEARVTDVALGRREALQRSRFLALDTDIPASDVQRVGETKTFLVKGSTDMYTVDMELELCSCREGHSGGPCRHQAAVDRHFGCFSDTYAPENAKMKAELLKLTSGEMEQMMDSDPWMDLHMSDSDDPSMDHEADDTTSEQPQTADHEVVEYMFNELQKYRSDAYHGPGLVAMAKQFKSLSRNPAEVLSAMHGFGKPHLTPPPGGSSVFLLLHPVAGNTPIHLMPGQNLAGAHTRPL